jgi:CBS domain-containing protein
MKLLSISPDDPFDEDEVTGELYTLGGLVETPVTSVHEVTPIAEVRTLLAELRVPAVVVIDTSRSLKGVITRTDVLRAPRECTAAEAMSRYVYSLPREATVERAAALMAIERVGEIVVTGDDGELVGLVSAFDIARHVAMRAGYIVA